MRPEKELPTLEFNIADLFYAMNGTVVMQKAMQMYYDLIINKLGRPGLGPWSFVLEAGAGSGKLSLDLAIQYKCHVTMVDNDPEKSALEIKLGLMAETMIGHRLDWTVRTADVTKLPYPENCFSLVASEGLIEHVPKDDRRRVGWLREMARVSREAVLVITNDADGPRSAQRAREHSFHYIGAPEKEVQYTFEELEANMKKAGLKEVQVMRHDDSTATQEYLLAIGVKA